MVVDKMRPLVNSPEMSLAVDRRLKPIDTSGETLAPNFHHDDVIFSFKSMKEEFSYLRHNLKKVKALLPPSTV